MEYRCLIHIVMECRGSYREMLQNDLQTDLGTYITEHSVNFVHKITTFGYIPVFSIPI